MTVIETHPIEASASGQNAYYCEFCNFGGHRPAYAACLNRINDRNSCGPNYTDCNVAIQRRHCPALAMREEEIEAGHAIYYIDRTAVQASNEQRLLKLGIHTNREAIEDAIIKFSPRLQQEETQAPQKRVFDSAGSVYADAINKAIAKSASTPATTQLSSSQISVSADLSSTDDKSLNVKPDVPNKFESGLSLQEIAERMKANA